METKPYSAAIVKNPEFGRILSVMALISTVLFSGLVQSAPLRVEKIFVSQFEEQPVEIYPRIEFISDRTQIFSGSGETRTAAVQVFDASGNLIADPGIDWFSGNGSLLSITTTIPGEAQLQSGGAWDGSLTYQAAYAPLGLTITGQATMADLAPGTVLIPSRWVLEALGDRFNEHTVVLERNGTTENLNVDDILVSGDAAGVSIRIITVEVSGDIVRLTATPASVMDAFETYSSSFSGEPVRIVIRALESQSTITTYSGKTDQLLSRQTLPGRSLLDAVECSGGLEVGTNISFDTLDLEIDLQPITDIDIASDGFVEIGMSGSVRAFAGLSVNASPGATLQGECSVDLPSLALPGVPLYVVSIAPRIDPGLGIRASAVAEANAGWVPISGLERTWSFDAGVRHTSSSGWNAFKSFDSIGPEPDSGNFSLSGELTLEAGAGVNVGVGLDFCLTFCLPWTVFASPEFMQVSGGPYWEFGIATPLDPANPAYLGPHLSAGVRAEGTAGLEVDFFDSGILAYIGVGGSASISFPIFSEQFEFIGTPTLGGSLTCSPDCGAMPLTGGTLDLQLTAAAAGTGTAEFWMGPIGDNLTLIGTAPFSNGQASSSLVADALSAGTYEVYPRLALDDPLFWVTSTWPVGSQTALGQFTVGNTDPPDLPTMVMIPAGSFVQGSPPDEPERLSNEGPQRTVNVPAFAMGQTEVTFDQWDACVADGGCSHNPDDQGWGRGNRPVIDVGWNDAQEYVTWLSKKTGEDYRLPSESEWEYATRAGTTGRFNIGDCITTDQANFLGSIPAQGCPAGENRGQSVQVASFAPNAFGLYGTHGNVWEWVQDCWNVDYTGAPNDGSAWMTGDCSHAVERGGCWNSPGQFLRSAYRFGVTRDYRHYTIGFRVARSVAP